MIFLAKRPSSPNALRALEELKMEIGKELSIENNYQTNSEINKIQAGTIGGMTTRNLVEMGQKKLIKRE